MDAKIILGVFVGAVAGAAAGLIFGYKYGYNKGCEDVLDTADNMVNEEIKKFKDDFHKYNKMVSDEYSEESEDDDEEEDIFVTKTSLDRPDERKTTHKPDISEIVRDYDDAEREFPTEEYDYDINNEEDMIVMNRELNAEIAGEEKLHAVPYIIDEETYRTDMPNYEKEDLIYFIPDGNMRYDDPFGEFVDNPLELIGDIYNSWNPTEDEEIIYVRNAKFAVDYKVISCTEPYDFEIGNM